MPLVVKDNKEYRNYLKSARWKELSLACKERFNFRCAWCNCNGDVCSLTAHHRSYDSICTKDELQDLICFCKGCHDDMHLLERQRENERLYAV